MTIFQALTILQITYQRKTYNNGGKNKTSVTF